MKIDGGAGASAEGPTGQNGMSGPHYIIIFVSIPFRYSCLDIETKILTIAKRTKI